MKTDMYRIAVCIPTYKRPAMLEKLVNSIYAGKLDDGLIREVDIIVVDNDADRTAEELVRKLSERREGPFKIHYHNHPLKGLVHVRNELIEQALRRKPDFLLLIDDDEYASPQWLHEMVSNLVINEGDLGGGPVISVFEKKVPPYIRQWFTRGNHPNYSHIDFVHTANLIIRAKYLLDHPDMRFDHRFNTTGAEDTYFGVSALKKGTKIWWARNAVVYETIPEDRATVNWILQRTYRGAITYTFIIILEKKYLKVAKKILVNFIYLLIGIPALIFTPFNLKFRYFGMLKIAESMGGFAGLFNFKYHEYATSK